jgi:hypothetical protein
MKRPTLTPTAPSEAKGSSTEPKPPSREPYDYDEIENKDIIETLRRINAKREARNSSTGPKHPSREVYGYDEVANKIKE